MRPIRLNKTTIETMVTEFVEELKKAKLSDGKLTYVRSFSYKGDDKATIVFTPEAYAKMLVLLDHFSTEVAWHGTAERVSADRYIINDIFVYPQEVSGATVNTDQEEYTKWLMGLDDDTANTLHMQAHSHVNMSTSPSTVDLNHQEAIISQLRDEDFYIFMIWNKRLEHTIKIYDMPSNTLYEDADINVCISDVDADAFVKESEEMVKRKFTPAATAGTGSYNGSYTSPHHSIIDDDDEFEPGSAYKSNGFYPTSSTDIHSKYSKPDAKESKPKSKPAKESKSEKRPVGRPKKSSGFALVDELFGDEGKE